MELDSTGCCCSIVPPYAYDELSRSPVVAHRDTARRSAAITERLRGQRDVYSLLSAFAVVPGTRRRTIYDARRTWMLPGTVVRGEDAPATGDAAADAVYDGSGSVWEFYKNVFNRDSLDDRGMRLDSTVHYGTGYANALWNGQQMVYGDGDGKVFGPFTAALDVIGHEMTHGVTQNASGLAYHGEAGALNEHISDVFGSLIKQRSLSQSAAAADWLIGAGILLLPAPAPPGAVARALRDMRNPGTAYAHLAIGSDPQPSNYGNLYTGSDDSGGVHINSGIPNKAFADYAVAVGGNAWDVPGRVWYRTATGMGLPSDATFVQFRDLTLEAAQLVAPTTVAALQQAWNGVGL
jgi:Zn-dependent metalloprotease